MQQYAIPVYETEYVANNKSSIEFTIDSLFFLMLLMNIRSETVRYSKIISKSKRQLENDLIKNITDKESKLHDATDEEKWRAAASKVWIGKYAQ